MQAYFNILVFAVGIAIEMKPDASVNFEVLGFVLFLFVFSSYFHMSCIISVIFEQVFSQISFIF